MPHRRRSSSMEQCGKRMPREMEGKERGVGGGIERHKARVVRASSLGTYMHTCIHIYIEDRRDDRRGGGSERDRKMGDGIVGREGRRGEGIIDTLLRDLFSLICYSPCTDESRKQRTSSS